MPSSQQTAIERPTNVRYLVLGVAMLMSLLLYLDRYCISFAERYIKEDLGLSNEAMGWILSAFFWSYGLGQVPSGWLSDRFGARTMLSLYIVLWSVFTALTGLASGFVMLFALRIGFGLGQAGAYPTAGSFLSRWFPITQRGMASGVVASGGRVGAVLAPLLTGFLIVLLVPVAAGSKIKPSDLIDPAEWSQKLVAPQPELVGLAERIVERLPSETQQIVKRNSAASPMSDADIGQLAGGIDLLLHDAQFYDPASMSELPLENEARRFLKRPRESLSPEQIQRVNRLILEAAYPEHFKKVYLAGWRPVLGIYGLAGILVAALFWFVFRNHPEQHPACNAAEVALIQHGKPPTSSQPLEAAPIGPLMRSKSMWLCSLSQVGTNLGWVFLVTWLPRYLQEVHRVPVEQRGVMVAMPILIGWVGMLLGGPLTDRATRKLGVRWGRALPMGLTRFLAMIAYLACLLPLSNWFDPSITPWILTAAFSMVAFSTDLGVAAVWAFNQDVGGRHVGSVLGWGNMWGNLGAAASPPLLNYVVREAGSWDQAFLLCAAGFFIAGVAALAVDATQPIE